MSSIFPIDLRGGKRLIKTRRYFCIIVMLAMLVTLIYPVIQLTIKAEQSSHQEESLEGHLIPVNGEDVDPYHRFKGYGAVSANNTSRLLLDYKEEHPDKYWEIMRLLF